MTDDQHLDLIDNAFADFRDGGPLATPLGADAARHTVQQRRRVRTTAAVALAAIVVITPTSMYAAGLLDSNAPPKPADSVAPAVTSSAPAPTEPTEAATTATPAAPDGRITDLRNATITLPGWPGGDLPCNTGPTKFTNGVSYVKQDRMVRLLKTVYVDVDHDGAEETIAQLHCEMGEVGYYSVVAFDRDASGKIVTMGKVVQSDLVGGSMGDELELIYDLRPAGTAVEVQVGDIGACCGTPTEITQRQWRAYSWNGSAFTQSGGPAKFPPNPHVTDLGVTAGNVTLRASDGGKVTGTLTVTVHNAGPVTTAKEGRLLVGLPDGASITSPPAGCQTVDVGYLGYGLTYACPLATLSVGSSKTVTLQISAPSGKFPAGSAGTLQARAEMAPKLTSFEPFPTTGKRKNFADVQFAEAA